MIVFRCLPAATKHHILEPAKVITFDSLANLQEKNMRNKQTGY